MAITSMFGNAASLMALIPKMKETTQAWSAWSSPERAAEYLQSKNAKDFWYTTPQTSDDLSFYGVSYKSALAMIKDGWQEGASRVRKMRDKINAKNPRGPRLVKYDVAGAFPVVARAIAGNPLNMRRMDSAKLRRRPIITLVNHMGGLADVDADCFVNKCAVVAAIVDSIEAAGYSCHVLGLAMAKTGSHLAGTVMQVKAPGEHVDTARMAMALGHVGMFRRIVFSLRACDQNNNDKLSGMGATADFPANISGTYVLPSMNQNAEMFSTEDKAMTVGLKHFIDTLASQGCPAFPKAEGAAA